MTVSVKGKDSSVDEREGELGLREEVHVETVCFM